MSQPYESIPESPHEETVQTLEDISSSYRSDDAELPPTPGSIMSAAEIQHLLQGNRGDREDREDRLGEDREETESVLQADNRSESTEHTLMNDDQGPQNNPPPPSIPRLSRAFSMPVASQLSHFVNPRRLSSSASSSALLSPTRVGTPPDAQHFQEVSLELADSVQMVIQTLLQLSPPQLLDPAKEQFAACSLSIPSPSISAMLTTMKNLNYMSANMASLASKFKEQTTDSEGLGAESPPQVLDEFDVGEMLQSVGDSLSGLAAQAGVELVLFHADVGMKHVGVKGDECGISYALSHVIRQVIETTVPGDTIEIGLYISPLELLRDSSESPPTGSQTGTSSPNSFSTNSADYGGLLRVTFDVAHKFAQADYTSNPPSLLVVTVDRPRPQFDSSILRRLLHRVRGTLKPDLRPRLFSIGRSTELSVILDPNSPLTPQEQLPEEEVSLRAPFAASNVKLASEPTLDELMEFAESLKGKKVALHASTQGSFAHHLTSYLTAWQVDVSHMPGQPLSDTDAAFTSAPAGVSVSTGEILTTVLTASEAAIMGPNLGTIPEGATKPAVIEEEPAFVVIDDDVPALRQRLLQWRAQAQYNLPPHPRQRPSLAANHRPRSSPHIARAKGLNMGILPMPAPPPVIVHFTSLSNYKLVKDAMQSFLATANIAPNAIPEVIVVPKPAGPRRFLTALRTAVLKPIVDPFFFPTATSPMSPSIHGLSPYSNFFSNSTPSGSSPRPSISPRANSDHSTRSSRETLGDTPSVPSSSPLGKVDPSEYFGDATVKLGASPSSGWLIQSPDGQATGIFFHPRPSLKGKRSQASTSKKDKKEKKEKPTSPLPVPPPLVREASELEWVRLSSIESPPLESLYAPSRQNPLRHRSSLSTTAELISEESAEEMPEVETPMVEEMMNSSMNTSGASSVAATPVVSGKGEMPVPPLLEEETEEEMVEAEEEITDESMDDTSPMVAAAKLSGTTPPFVRAMTDKGLALNVMTRGQGSTPPVSPHSPQRVPTSPVVTGSFKRPNTRRMTGGSNVSTSSRHSKSSVENNIVPPIRVLIVEDNPINQTILSTFMKRKKIKYDVANHGEEAVAKWKDGGFHLILMDIQMPVMDGIEATKEIRRQERLISLAAYPQTPSPGHTSSDKDRNPLESKASASSPGAASNTSSVSTPYKPSVIIVALTASSLQSDRVAALAAGCNDFLTKPVSLSWLNSKIIEWGSLKALQMWSDLRPEVVKNIAHEQAAHARNVANRLHVPEGRRTGTLSRNHTSNTYNAASVSHDSSTSQTPTDLATPRATSSTPVSGDGVGVSPLVAQRLRALATSPTQEYNELLQEGADKVLEKGKPNRPEIVTGEEALRSHIQDFQKQVTLNASADFPIMLGHRALGSVNTSIHQVLHPTPTLEAKNDEPLSTVEYPQSTAQPSARSDALPSNTNPETEAAGLPDPSMAQVGDSETTLRPVQKSDDTVVLGGILRVAGLFRKFL